MMPSDKRHTKDITSCAYLWKGGRRCLTLLNLLFPQLQQLWLSVHTAAAGGPQLPAAWGWRCGHTRPQARGSETYYYLRFLIQQCPVCICDKYLDNIILVHIYILAQRRCTQKYSIYGKSDLSLTLSYVIQHDRSTADIKLYVQAIFFTINTYC